MQAFDEIYRHNLNYVAKNAHAWKIVEKQFTERFGKPRYSSYDSFKSAYHRRNKSKH